MSRKNSKNLSTGIFLDAKHTEPLISEKIRRLFQREFMRNRRNKKKKKKQCFGDVILLQWQNTGSNYCIDARQQCAGISSGPKHQRLLSAKSRSGASHRCDRVYYRSPETERGIQDGNIVGSRTCFRTTFDLLSILLVSSVKNKKIYLSCSSVLRETISPRPGDYGWETIF